LPATISRLKAAVWRAVVRDIDAGPVNFFCAGCAITVAVVSAHFAASALGHTHVITNVVCRIFRAVDALVVIVY